MIGLTKQLGAVTRLVGSGLRLGLAPVAGVPFQQVRESGMFARKNKKTVGAIKKHRKMALRRDRNNCATPFDAAFLCDLKTFRNLPIPEYLYSEAVNYYKPAPTPNHDKYRKSIEYECAPY